MKLDLKKVIYSSTVTSETDIIIDSQDSKSKVVKPSNIDPNDHEIRLLDKIDDKLHWLQLYYQAYDGELVPINPSFFGPTRKYLVLNAQGIDVGFAMISEINQQMQAYYGWSAAWKADFTLVKEPYRGRGYQRLLLENAIAEHGCKAINLLYQRYLDNQDYFASLGFNSVLATSSTSILVLDDDLISTAIETRPQDFKRISASTEDELLEAFAHANGGLSIEQEGHG